MAQKKAFTFKSINIADDLEKANRIILNLTISLDKYFDKDNFGRGSKNLERVNRWRKEMNDYMQESGVDLEELKKESL